MSDSWYYAEGNSQVGPIPLRDLQAVLRRHPNWRSLLVWREGFDGWKRAGIVTDLTFEEVTPPPLPSSATELALDETPKNKGRVAKIFSGIVLLAVTLVAIVIGRQAGREGYRAVSHAIGPDNATQIERGFAEAEQKLKATLPKQIDDSTTMVDVSHRGPIFTYYYVLDTKGMTFPTSSDFNSEMKKIVTPKICESAMKSSMNNGAVYEYSYKDVRGREVGSFQVRISDCR